MDAKAELATVTARYEAAKAKRVRAQAILAAFSGGHLTAREAAALRNIIVRA